MMHLEFEYNGQLLKQLFISDMQFPIVESVKYILLKDLPTHLFINCNLQKVK